MPFFIASSPVHNRFQTCTSRPHALGSVSTRDPPILSIRVLHFRMDRVAVAQLIFSGTSTEASVLSIFSAHVTDTCWLCNDFANRDQKSLFATFQSHSSISSIKSVNELQCHSVNVRANCASIIFLTTSSCRMHWSTCCSKACVSTPDGRGHSWPPSAVGKVYREFALDHGTCHAFLYACTQIFCRLSNSLCDHSMRAAENRKAPIPFCAKSSAESSGVSGWLLIRSRATLAFSRTTSLVALMSPFPVPQ
mmetsp:Transcript_42065/g.61835  ORF Transcript_42065/g.61835 Transcript_42065/m.61835 type:complete len:250 (-) Transcript_42065:174-923(-)